MVTAPSMAASANGRRRRRRHPYTSVVQTRPTSTSDPFAFWMYHPAGTPSALQLLIRLTHFGLAECLCLLLCLCRDHAPCDHVSNGLKPPRCPNNPTRIALGLLLRGDSEHLLASACDGTMCLPLCSLEVLPGTRQVGHVVGRLASISYRVRW